MIRFDISGMSDDELKKFREYARHPRIELILSCAVDVANDKDDPPSLLEPGE